MVIEGAMLVRLRALADKALDEGSTEAERNTSARMLARELKKLFQCSTGGVAEDVSRRPSRRTVVDVPQADFRRAPPPRSNSKWVHMNASGDPERPPPPQEWGNGGRWGAGRGRRG